MPLTKLVNGVRVEMTAQEESDFLAQQAADTAQSDADKIKIDAAKLVAQYKDEAIELLLRYADGENVTAEIQALKNNINTEKGKL